MLAVPADEIGPRTHRRGGGGYGTRRALRQPRPRRFEAAQRAVERKANMSASPLDGDRMQRILSDEELEDVVGGRTQVLSSDSQGSWYTLYGGSHGYATLSDPFPAGTT